MRPISIHAHYDMHLNAGRAHGGSGEPRALFWASLLVYMFRFPLLAQLYLLSKRRVADLQFLFLLS